MPKGQLNPKEAQIYQTNYLFNDTMKSITILIICYRNHHAKFRIYSLKSNKPKLMIRATRYERT